ncbi:hypothetical protein ACSQ67_022164 [Phaseolus vulgaris]
MAFHFNQTIFLGIVIVAMVLPQDLDIHTSTFENCDQVFLNHTEKHLYFKNTLAMTFHFNQTIFLGIVIVAMVLPQGN